MGETRRWRRALAIAALSCAPTGCFKATFEEPQSPYSERHEVWLDGYLFGLVGEGEVDTRFHCESGTTSVGVYESTATWVLTALSLGVYTPRRAWVTCVRAAPGRRKQ